MIEKYITECYIKFNEKAALDICIRVSSRQSDARARALMITNPRKSCFLSISSSCFSLMMTKGMHTI